jgi:hypothetical protein
MRDITAINHGTIIQLHATTPAGADWLTENLPGDTPMLGGTFCVEARYAGDILEGAQCDGLTVE